MKKSIILCMICMICGVAFGQHCYSLNSLKEFTPPKKVKFSKEHPYEPYMQVFLADKTKSAGKSIMIFPGGGYGMVAWSREGIDWVPFYKNLGINVFVVKYAMPFGEKETTFQSVRNAMSVIKAHAQEWNVNIDSVGVMGSSAGGHLASTVATHFTEPFRPAFQVLFYPVITMDASYTHEGSRDNLLGKKPNKKIVEEYSNEKQVTPQTPPAIIMVSYDDQIVDINNSINYFKSLKKNDVPASLHIYTVGNHGWGSMDSFLYHDTMLQDLTSWLNNL